MSSRILFINILREFLRIQKFFPIFTCHNFVIPFLWSTFLFNWMRKSPIYLRNKISRAEKIMRLSPLLRNCATANLVDRNFKTSHKFSSSTSSGVGHFVTLQYRRYSVIVHNEIEMFIITIIRRSYGVTFLVNMGTSTRVFFTMNDSSCVQVSIFLDLYLRFRNKNNERQRNFFFWSDDKTHLIIAT